MKPHLFALGLLLAPLPSFAQGAPRLLRFHYVAGQRARYTTRTTQTMPGALGTSTTTATQEVETVRVNADGSALQRMRIVSMELDGPMIPPTMRERVTAAMRGLTLEFTQDARGRVTARHPVGEVSPELRPVLDGVLESLDQIGAPLPEGPVAPGATWSERRTIHLTPGPTSLDMNVDATYTLRTHAGTGNAESAVVGVTMAISTPAGGATAPQGLRMSGSGEATGESTLDLGQGRVGRGQTQGTMRIQLTVGGRAVDLDTRFQHEMTRAEGPTPASITPASAAPSTTPPSGHRGHAPSTR